MPVAWQTHLPSLSFSPDKILSKVQSAVIFTWLILYGDEAEVGYDVGTILRPSAKDDANC